MRKSLQLLVVLGLSCFAGGAFAQSLQITSCEIDDSQYPNLRTTKLGIKNISGASVPVMAKRVKNKLPANHESFFCFDQCYPTTVNESQNPVNIAAGATDNTFYSDLQITMAGTTVGTADQAFVFYNKNNKNDSLYVTLCTTSSSIGDKGLNARVTLSSPIPNPANTYTTLVYSIPGSVVKSSVVNVYNALGTVVYSAKIEEANGSLTIPTAQLGEGIYFYSLAVNGKSTLTKKLIVTHKN